MSNELGSVTTPFDDEMSNDFSAIMPINDGDLVVSGQSWGYVCKSILVTVAGTGTLVFPSGKKLANVDLFVGWHPMRLTCIENISGATIYATRTI